MRNVYPPEKVFLPLDGVCEVVATCATQVADLRRTITDQLIAAGRLPEGTSPHRVRIRDKVGNNPGRAIRDGRSLQDSKVYLFDNKVLAVQLLDAEEDLSTTSDGGGGSSAQSEELGDALISVQRWHRSTWSLGERFEVMLRGSMSVRDVARALSALTGVPTGSMLAMVVPRDTEVLLSDLVQKSPARNYGRGWFDPTQERKLLRFMTHELRVGDSDLLLLQDHSEPLKELSPADLRSIEIVAAAAAVPYTDAWSLGDMFAQADSTVTWSGASGSSIRSTSGANGVRIKTHQERMREDAEKQQQQQQQAVTDSEGSNGSTVGSQVDEREFQRHGGVALFSDLS